MGLVYGPRLTPPRRGAWHIETRLDLGRKGVAVGIPDDEKERKKQRLMYATFAVLGVLMLIISFIAGKTIREKLDESAPLTSVTMVIHEI